MQGTWGELRGWWARWTATLSEGADTSRLAALLSSTPRLVATLRPYLQGGLDNVSPWLVGDLVDALGAGVVSVALEAARTADLSTPETEPYYDALEVEIALAQGRSSDALSLVDQALATLPKGEAALQARVAALGAKAALQRGDSTRYLGFLEQAMTRDPGVIRRLGMTLPVIFRVENEPTLTATIPRLLRSPRLVEHTEDPAHAFVVLLERKGPAWSACLQSPKGSVLSCATLPVDPKKTPDEESLALALEFHEQAFAARVGLQSMDLHSLDGSNTLASEAERRELKKALEDVQPTP